MVFWSQLHKAAGFGGAYHWVMLAFVAAALVLAGIVPESRRRIAGALLLFLGAFAAFVAAAAIATWRGPESAAYPYFRSAGLAVQAVAIINIAGILLFKVILKGLRLEPPPIIRDLVLAAAYIIACIGLLSQMGVNLTGIVATSAVVTAVVAFSLQDTLGNTMGGMVLQMERSISVGDWIRVGEHEGMVREIRWRQTSVETRNWDTIIIPNSVLMKSHVIVLGRRTGQPRQQRQWVHFHVDYRHSPTEVIAAAETALASEPIASVAESPRPHCIMTDYRDSYGTYAVRYWLTDLALVDLANSAVRARIFTALKRAGIAPSIPAQSVFVTHDDQPRRQRKLDEELQRRMKALRRVDLFEPLTEEERQELAMRLRPAPFIRGETMTRQGSESHDFYIITRGSAEVRIATSDGKATQTVATLKHGDFFGEMGLMTGELRSATVVALSDTACYRLDHEGFTDILRQRPQIAEGISRILACRRAELDAAREGLNAEAMRQRARSAENDLLRRIRSFFTLSDTKKVGV